MLSGMDLRKACNRTLVCGGWYRDQSDERIQWVCYAGAGLHDWAVYAVRTESHMADIDIAFTGSKLGSAEAFALTGADEDAKSLYRY